MSFDGVVAGQSFDSQPVSWSPNAVVPDVVDGPSLNSQSSPPSFRTVGLLQNERNGAGSLLMSEAGIANKLADKNSMKGFQVVTIESVAGEVDIFTTTTGNLKIISLEHMKKVDKQCYCGKHRSLRQRD